MPTFRALINSFDVDSLPATGAIISVLRLPAFPPRMRKSDCGRVWKAGNPYMISKLSGKYQFCTIHTADNTDG